ncbi:hypothetical protein [Pseudobdellovibrio exovorus]|uniref:Uncharacterized protein n=1 Tax=Pseudobdellovibrio exovorus JSS TaxID=1184267 RepID=M4VBG3_9BACT|nr:hypothetical protein [Pseudobdellovibrio exovorus]AGH95825.1 hypothetical protein A11Q_1609 [Pseudobdellovibrio exovorus JSS]
MKKMMYASILLGGLLFSGSLSATVLTDTSLLTEENCRKIKNAQSTQDADTNEQLRLIKEECLKKHPQLK